MSSGWICSLWACFLPGRVKVTLLGRGRLPLLPAHGKFPAESLCCGTFASPKMAPRPFFLPDDLSWQAPALKRKLPSAGGLSRTDRARSSLNREHECLSWLTAPD